LGQDSIVFSLCPNGNSSQVLGARLESVYTSNRIVGSNPTLSVINFFMQRFIYKICKISEWINAQKKGKFIGTQKDLEDGYIHFSKRNQIKSTLKKHFLNEDNLTLLKIDTSKLNNLIFEKSRNDNFFPHLYSDLKLNHVKKKYKITLRKNGHHTLPSTF